MADPVSDALSTCRAYALLAGDPALPDWYGKLADSILTVLAQYQLATDQLDEARETLRAWGIPMKQRTMASYEKKGFERGWNDPEG